MQQFVLQGGFAAPGSTIHRPAPGRRPLAVCAAVAPAVSTLNTKVSEKVSLIMDTVLY
jgi:hypothetical protein